MLYNECQITLFKGATADHLVHVFNCLSSGFEVLQCVMVSLSKKKTPKKQCVNKVN